MSRHSSHEHAAENTEALEVIREEQCSPAVSSVNINDASKTDADASKQCVDCTCAEDLKKIMDLKIDAEELERIMMEKEKVLRNEFHHRLEGEIGSLKERFDFILQNEQTRTSYMLREAHRERQEKIGALLTQLECKNLAGLMYVMCTERRKSKLERLRLIEEYTSYIRALQSILADGQDLILHLSRGYKTAARVDHEWRDKMKKIVKEFQAYVYNFSGGTTESNQYLFDLPTLLKTNAPIYDNPKEDPIEYEEVEGEEEEYEDPNAEKPWWKLIEGDCKPFVMFGDMSEFKPPQRREVLKTVKAAKTAPKKWKEYVFNEMFLRSDCSNADVIKDEYPIRTSFPGRWECTGVQTDRQQSRTSFGSRRVTTASIDVKGNMGSILKIMPCPGRQRAERALRAVRAVEAVYLVDHAPPAPPAPLSSRTASHKSMNFDQDARAVARAARSARWRPGRGLTFSRKKTSSMVDTPTKPNLLAARDSMEIQSTTRLRDKKHSIKHTNQSKVVINVGSRRASAYDQVEFEDERQEKHGGPSKKYSNLEDEEDESLSLLGSIHNDSLQVIAAHVPDKDHKINYEKVCPMEKCQRLEVDSFIRSLPPYMRANPFTHFEQSFENYETCTPEQLEILKQRIDDKQKKKIPEHVVVEEGPLSEWSPEVEGVAVQTSDESLPPCTCRVPSPTPVSSVGRMFDLADLIPIKQNLDEIRRDCFYDGSIEFDRFRVIGQKSDESIHVAPKQDFKKTRLYEIKRILKQHPSLCEIFQANAQC